MRTVLAILTMLFGAALLAATPCAHAFGPGGGGPMFMRGHGGPGGPGGGPPFRLLVAQMSPDQRAQVRQILRADRVEMRQIVKALHDAHERAGLTMRGHDRVLRVARTLADLDGSDRVLRRHVAQAVAYREPPPVLDPAIAGLSV